MKRPIRVTGTAFLPTLAAFVRDRRGRGARSEKAPRRAGSGTGSPTDEGLSLIGKVLRVSAGYRPRQPSGEGEDIKQRRAPPRALGGLVGIVVALAAFLAYLGTLAPTVLHYGQVAMKDSVGIQVRAYVLGIPDVTGYPTYIMLAHLFTYLPFGDPAYRVNLASAVFAALAVLLLYLLCLRLTGRVVPSAAAALLFGTSRTFWSQAVVAEVYTLNALFVALVLLVLLAWRERRQDRYLLLACFLTGLSLTHHLTSGLLLPTGVLFVAMVDRRRLADAKLLLKGTGLFFLGLTPYLYLPVRAAIDLGRVTSVDPTLVTYDPSTPSGFLGLVTGSEFGSSMFAFGPSELSARVTYYLDQLLEQFHPAFLTMAAVGVAWMLLRDRAGLVLFGFLYLGWLVFALEYRIQDVFVYFIPTFLVLCVWAAAGFGCLLQGAEALASRLPAVPRRAALAAVSALLILAPLSGVGENRRAVDRSGDYEGSRIIDAVAAEAKPDATVVHHRSPLWYMELVEGRRLDIKLADPYHSTPDHTGVATAAEALKSGPVYVLLPNPSDVPFYRRAGYSLVPVEKGVLYEVVRR